MQLHIYKRKGSGEVITTMFQNNTRNLFQNTSVGILKIAIILVLFLLLSSVCFAENTTNESVDAEDAAGRVTVTDVSLEPSVLMTGDVGLVTFTVQNTGNDNVAISDAHFISKDVTVLNSDTYLSSRTIGAGTEMKFSFTILANQPENIYYPTFYLNYRDAGSLRYNIPIRVEEPQLSLSVSGIPETFANGVTRVLNLQVGNAKSVNMTGITVIPSGEGIQCNRTSFFIADLQPHSEKSVLFEITPSASTNLVFNVTYTCGMNAHQMSYSIPVNLGSDKQAADPVLNNIETESAGSDITISGDVSNVGISDAYGVMVSLKSAAGEDGNPNQKYALGTITSGDYSSFELTVPQSKTIPLIIQWRDESGNQFTKNVSLDESSISGSSGGTAGIGGGTMPTGGMPPGGAPGTSSGTQGGGSGGGPRAGGVNPMNPMSGMGSGLDKVPVTEILVGLGILIAALIGWRLWKRKRNGRNRNSP